MMACAKPERSRTTRKPKPPIGRQRCSHPDTQTVSPTCRANWDVRTREDTVTPPLESNPPPLRTEGASVVPPQFALGTRCRARSEPLGRITGANRRDLKARGDLLALFPALKRVVRRCSADRAHSRRRGSLDRVQPVTRLFRRFG